MAILNVLLHAYVEKSQWFDHIWGDSHFLVFKELVGYVSLRLVGYVSVSNTLSSCTNKKEMLNRRVGVCSKFSFLSNLCPYGWWFKKNDYQANKE